MGDENGLLARIQDLCILLHEGAAKYENDIYIFFKNNPTSIKTSKSGTKIIDNQIACF